VRLKHFALVLLAFERANFCLGQLARRVSLEPALDRVRAIHETDEALKGQSSLPHELLLERLVLGLSA